LAEHWDLQNTWIFYSKTVASEDLLSKNVSCTYIIIKITLKMAFLWQTPKQKVFKKDFA
jgi:hypothetical protein